MSLPKNHQRRVLETSFATSHCLLNAPWISLVVKSGLRSGDDVTMAIAQGRTLLYMTQGYGQCISTCLEFCFLPSVDLNFKYLSVFHMIVPVLQRAPPLNVLSTFNLPTPFTSHSDMYAKYRHNILNFTIIFSHRHPQTLQCLTPILPTSSSFFLINLLLLLFLPSFPYSSLHSPLSLAPPPPPPRHVYNQCHVPAVMPHHLPQETACCQADGRSELRGVGR